MTRKNSRRILAIPYVRSTNGLRLMHRYQLTPAEYTDILINQFDEMLVQSHDTPLVFCLFFHPYFAGHAFRLKDLRRVYKHITSHANRIWLARTGEIAKHSAGLPGVVPGS